MTEQMFKQTLIHFGVPVEISDDIETCRSKAVELVMAQPERFNQLKRGFDALETSEDYLEPSVDQFIRGFFSECSRRGVF